ncbi:sodium bile acid symporter family-domain-containing protein [Gautieria morchelliformis]|nr:sodium bile acid symporter family-domain-containing protein [Gautieria morchelliformis]
MDSRLVTSGSVTEKDIEALGTSNVDQAPQNVSDVPSREPEHVNLSSKALLRSLSFLDRFLAVWILLFMVLGVIIGNYAPNVQQAFQLVTFNSVSLPIAIGLIVMMWPVLAKVQYELLPIIFTSPKIWIHIGISLVLNWIFAPLIMLGLAWATLPDLPNYRTGVILVGLARCIAMVMIWNQLAGGDMNYCAILVVINSVLQIILYAPYALLFVNVIGGQAGVHVDYASVAKSVLIYLGIPLLLGGSTRALVYFVAGPSGLAKFLRYFSPVALIGLLYTVIVIFASQGKRISHNLGPVFRVFVPMILYFLITWTLTFFAMWWFSRKYRNSSRPNIFGYDIAVVQAFTAGSNNFELAIAVAVGVYGVNSEQALAATIGPLVEVPVLLGLSWVALKFERRLRWDRLSDGEERK